MLVRALQKAGTERKQGIWKAIATHLSKPTRIRPSVNLSKLERLSRRFSGKTFVVPGKVLGTGILSQAVNVAAFSFSSAARKKIVQHNGKCHSLSDLLVHAKPAGLMIVV